MGPMYTRSMPLYEYRCRECHHQFEALLPSYSANSATCPTCGAAEPRRLISVIAGMANRTAAPVPT
jgi:putative FmdB family regulatory protein